MSESLIYLRPTQKRYAIVECPRCSGLQLVRPAVKSHKCSYCNRIIRLNSPRIRTICFASTPREASRTIMRLKSKEKPRTIFRHVCQSDKRN